MGSHPYVHRYVRVLRGILYRATNRHVTPSPRVKPTVLKCPSSSIDGSLCFVESFLVSHTVFLVFYLVTYLEKHLAYLPPADRFTQHRYKADQAFELDVSKSPVAQYLDIDTIVKICVDNGVEAVHPGYGL